RFKSCGKIYDFEINVPDVRKGASVIVESEFGLNIGRVVVGPRNIENLVKVLKKVLRLATDEDLSRKQENRAFEQETMEYCLERIMARGIPMKLVRTEVTLDRKRILFYFTADGRIDFRELVKDLAAKFRTRIEMRQIGVRDKAKMVGGLGQCGKELCCRSFLATFEPVSIKMAKQQDLVLNTGKLSGICGRLMCCLGFEYNGSGSVNFVKDSTKKSGSVSAKEESSEVAVEESGNKSPGTDVRAAKAPAGPPDSRQEKEAVKKTGQPPIRHKRRRKRPREGVHKK
ncbi:MAG: stage 0 sporulation family protein, partial [Nitrospirota bacterium]|nr:stage 0 sporulation family protein [Nitrospirota bacterium]